MNAKARRTQREERQGVVGFCGRMLGLRIEGGGARLGPFFCAGRGKSGFFARFGGKDFLFLRLGGLRFGSLVAWVELAKG